MAADKSLPFLVYNEQLQLQDDGKFICIHANVVIAYSKHNVPVVSSCDINV